MSDPPVEDKQARPPPRCNEGMLIDAMRNAWRLGKNKVLRQRAESIGAAAAP